MKNIFTFLLLVFIGGSFCGTACQFGLEYSKPECFGVYACGGGDIGMNVWVENDDVLFYLSRSGSFCTRITVC